MLDLSERTAAASYTPNSTLSCKADILPPPYVIDCFDLTGTTTHTILDVRVPKWEKEHPISAEGELEGMLYLSRMADR